MQLSYEQLNETIEKGGVQAGVELIVYALLATNKITLTDKGKREISAFLITYVKEKYGFTAEMLILFGLHKQDWLMELIREAMLSPELMELLSNMDPETN